MYDGIDFVLGRQREAMQYFGLEGAARRKCLWSCPVHSRDSALVVPSICVFSAINHDTGVQEGRPDRPEYRGESARLLHC